MEGGGRAKGARDGDEEEGISLQGPSSPHITVGKVLDPSPPTGLQTPKWAAATTNTHFQRNGAFLDWIPLDNLVVLVLPPRPDSRFPATHDITLAGRPHVGFAVPFELLHCVETIAAPPLLRRELVFSEPPQMYLLSRLQAFKIWKGYSAACSCSRFSKVNLNQVPFR